MLPSKHRSKRRSCCPCKRRKQKISFAPLMGQSSPTFLWNHDGKWCELVDHGLWCIYLFNSTVEEQTQSEIFFQCEWAWLCCNIILFITTGSGQGLTEGYKLLTPALDYERGQSNRKKKKASKGDFWIKPLIYLNILPDPLHSQPQGGWGRENLPSTPGERGGLKRSLREGLSVN